MHVSRSVFAVLVLLPIMLGALACQQEAQLEQAEKKFNAAVQEAPEQAQKADKKLEETLAE